MFGKKSIIIMAFVAVVFLVVSAVTSVDTASADSEFSVTDSTGQTYTFSSPVDHIVTLGYGFTITVVESGCADKIVGIDKYSKYSYTNDERMEVLNNVIVVGTGYTSDSDNILANMVQLVDSGKFDIDSDVIILNNFTSTLSSGGLRDVLVNHGFKVLCYGATSYDEVVSIVEDMAKLLGSEKCSSLASQMTYVKEYIAKVLEDNNITDVTDAVYVSYSSSVIKIGNTGSLAVDYIISAGGNNSGEDSSKASPTYASEAPALLQMGVSVILLDGNYDGTADHFCNDVLHTTDITVWKMEKSWNSYGTDALDGLWAVAGYLYPDLFDGPVPDNSSSSDNTLYYVIAGVVIAAVVLLAVYIIKR
ncbi:MAG: hypothetical protein M0Q19_09905 [Candidatus Cloacimonetes bacterium]|nr:hypothetical protein [Candidatus Cloacimonadota bacterium]MCK9333465.1 hypothetical protein [Candidatus Cloacimonadota bacterium]